MGAKDEAVIPPLLEGAHTQTHAHTRMHTLHTSGTHTKGGGRTRLPWGPQWHALERYELTKAS